MHCSTGLEDEAACPPVVFLHAGGGDAAGRNDVQLVLVLLQRRGAYVFYCPSHLHRHQTY